MTALGAGRPAAGQTLRCAVALFTVLVAIYLLTFCGEFKSIDELAMYARTESLVQFGRLDTPQVEFAAMHNPVGEIEPGQSLAAAPFYALAQPLRQVSTIHAVLLLNVLVTALTGAVVFLILRQVRVPNRVACLAALGYGLATTAWPYARTFFREPLVALAWAIATLAVLRWRERGAWVDLALCLAAVVLAVPVKSSAIAAVPVFLAVIGQRELSRRSVRRVLPLAGAGGLALLMGAGLYASRFGRLPPIGEYTLGYPWGDFLRRSYGQLLSPYKGLLVYSPVLVAALWGWPAWFRRSRALAWLTLGVTLALLYLYGNHPMWYGGLVWGPRFMLPLLPLLILPLAATLTDRRRSVRWVGYGATALSLAWQLPVAVAAWGTTARQADPAINDTLRWEALPWRLSPPVYQATHWQPEWLNLLWWRRVAEGGAVRDLALAAVLLLLLMGAIALLIGALRTQGGRRAGPTIVIGALIVVVGCGVMLWRGGRVARDYAGLPLADGRRLAEMVSAPHDKPYTLVTVSNEFGIYYWLGLIRGHYRHYWLSPAVDQGFDRVLQGPSETQAIWLVVDRVHMQADHHPYAAQYWLNQNAYPMAGAWVGGFEVFQYLPPVELAPRETPDVLWRNGIVLTSCRRQAAGIQRGAALRLELTFAGRLPLDQDYTLFTHLLGPDGRNILGRDGQPQYGGAPTSSWPTGEPVIDRRAIAIPGDAAPGTYTLIAGFVDPAGKPVPVGPASGETQADYAALGTVEILP